MRIKPPKKKTGQAVGPRTIDGAMMDVERGAAFLGLPPKGIRARAERGIIPYRRLGGRLVFLKTELEEFLQALDGVNLHQALGNLTERAGRTARNAKK